jgi:hypothetical protein
MEVRKCRYCSGAISAEKRADTKFCSNSCKANYWEENKEKQKAPQVKAVQEREKPKVTDKPLDGLRGVVENKPKIDVTAVKEPSKPIENEQIMPTTTKVERQAYKEASEAVKKAEERYQHVRNTYNNCEKYLQAWLQEKGKLQKVKPMRRFNTTNIDALAIMDKFDDEVSQSEDRFCKRKQVDEKIATLTNNKTKLDKILPAAKKALEEAQQKLKSIPQYEPVKQKPVVFASGLMKGIGQIKLRQDEQKPEQTELKHEEEKQIESRTAIQSNSKLISSRELREMNYKCLNFQGRWNEFFGLPAVVFHLAVHGKPGEGKSTFCIQFADYLAKNFGHVVYVSGEEGFSKTLRDKVVNNKIDNPYLFFADISSFEQIKNEIENNKFHFIFIDSLDNLRIDAVRLRELREYYPQSAFITISQSTKDGKMRGSQEIIHDTDIAVKVEDGIAVTTKNRYQEKGTEFRVFPTSGKPASKMIGEPRNVI